MRSTWQPPFPPYQRPIYTPPPFLNPATHREEQPVLTPQQPQSGIPPVIKPSLDGVPIVQHSNINLADFVRHKVAPSLPASLPYVESMDWHFDEPRDETDHEVRLFVVLSQEERALIRRWGLQHHAFEQEALFDDETLEALQLAQQHELEGTSNRASLAIEHKQQLAMIREAKVDITIEDYMAYPYHRQFANRYQATNGQKKLQGIMNSIRKMLEEYSAR